jgi:pterin-4a-carbinolamine dehydratase
MVGLAYIGKAMHQFALAVSALAVRAGIGMITEDLDHSPDTLLVFGHISANIWKLKKMGLK